MYVYFLTKVAKHRKFMTKHFNYTHNKVRGKRKLTEVIIIIQPWKLAHYNSKLLANPHIHIRNMDENVSNYFKADKRSLHSIVFWGL